MSTATSQQRSGWRPSELVRDSDWEQQHENLPNSTARLVDQNKQHANVSFKDVQDLIKPFSVSDVYSCQ